MSRFSNFLLFYISLQHWGLHLALHTLTKCSAILTFQASFDSIIQYVKKKKIFLFFFYFLQNRISLCSSGCPGAHSVDYGLKLINPPASASQVLEFKACVTTPTLLLVSNTVTVYMKYAMMFQDSQSWYSEKPCLQINE